MATWQPYPGAGSNGGAAIPAPPQYIPTANLNQPGGVPQLSEFGEASIASIPFGVSAIPAVTLSIAPTLFADFVNGIYAVDNGSGLMFVNRENIVSIGAAVSGGYVVNAAGNTQPVISRDRLTYDPSSHHAIGLLVEPVNQNLMTGALDLATNWNGGADTQGKPSTDLLPDADGAIIYKALRDSNPNDNCGSGSYTFSTATNGVWNLSLDVYIPSGATNTAIAVNIGGAGSGVSSAVASADLTKLDCWQRVSLTTGFANVTAFTFVVFVLGPPGTVVYYKKPQLEKTLVTSFGFPARPVENANFVNGLAKLGGPVGTLVLTMQGIKPSASLLSGNGFSSGGIEVSDGTANNVISLQSIGDGNNANLTVQVKVAGVVVMNAVGGYLTDGQTVTMAISWQNGLLSYADSQGYQASVTGQAIPALLSSLNVIPGSVAIQKVTYSPSATNPALLAQLAGGFLQAQIKVQTANVLRTVPPDFVGISFETNDTFAQHRMQAGSNSLGPLIARLGSSGALRIGGNSSDDGSFEPTGGEITDLQAFLAEYLPNWSLFFGLNVGTGTTAAAATVATEVVAALGASKVHFQLGNEPDLYFNTTAPLRTNTYSFNNTAFTPYYVQDWQSFNAAVLAAVPAAQFSGPDVASTSSWVLGAATVLKASGLSILTRHLYPTIGTLTTIPKLLETAGATNRMLKQNAKFAVAAGLPIRMTETNSVSTGPTTGVSDTQASAIWALEYLIQLMNAGWVGANFHNVGNTYSPLYLLAAGPPASYGPMPLYYAMLMFAQLTQKAGNSVVFTSTATNELLPTLAAVGNDGLTRVIIVNKNLLNPAQVFVDQDIAWSNANVMIITASAFNSNNSTTLGDATVDSFGNWSPTPVIVPKGTMITIPPASAALIVMG